jgi:hypothetical protein
MQRTNASESVKAAANPEKAGTVFVEGGWRVPIIKSKNCIFVDKVREGGVRK